MMLSSVIEALLWVLRANLVLFTVVGVLLTLRVFQYRWRLRSVRLWWYARPLGVFPIFGLFFLLCVLSLRLLSQLGDSGIGKWEWWCYLLMALCIFLLTRELSLIYITNRGIIKNLTNPDQSIPWFAVIDYVQYKDGNTFRYVILYKEETADSPQRISIRVPQRKEEQFRAVLEKNVRI